MRTSAAYAQELLVSFGRSKRQTSQWETVWFYLDVKPSGELERGILRSREHGPRYFRPIEETEFRFAETEDGL
ncbi:UNVERIFIED_CONTAM: hypothetical protein K2H54_076145 [Gekko kuhli]